MYVRSGDNAPDTVRRIPAIVWGTGAAAAVVLLASTIEAGAFQRSLLLRAAVMCAGMIPAAFVLLRLAPGGVVDHRNRRRFFLAVLVVHVLATLYFFPPTDILNDRPVVTLDHSFHYYQAVRAREVFWETFRIDRYDPYFMAGYPGGTIFDIDMKGAETFCAFFPLVGVARALKWFILISYLTMIPVIYWGSRMQGFRIGESTLGLLVFLAFWHWGRPYAGDFRYAGMFAFVFASHLGFLLVGLLRQVARGRWVKTFLGLGPLTFLIHPTAIVMLPVPFAVALGIDRRLWSRRKCLVLAAWCVAVLALNVMWLKPFFEYVWMKTTTELYYQIAGLGGLGRILLKPTCLIALTMIALAVTGAIRLARERRLATALPAATAAVFMFFVAGWGVYMPGVNQLEPGRFLLSAFIFLAPLAGAGAMSVASAVSSALPNDRLRRILRPAALVSMVLVILPLALLESKSFYRHTVKTTLAPQVAALVDSVAARVEPPGRLMIEDSEAMYYGDTHLPALLPLVTGVEQIGGPYPHTFLLYYFTSFRWEETFGRPLEEWDADSLRDYLELYDVRWILTATGRSGEVMSRLVGRPADWTQPPYALWRLGGYSGPFSPVVRSSINRLEVHGGGHLDGYFIKYHWIPGLEASGNAVIKPVRRRDDPVPFIYIEPNGDESVTITY